MWRPLFEVFQNYGDASLTPDGLNQRMALVNESIAANSDPAALQTLQQVQTTLQKCLTKLTPASPPPGGTP